MFGDFTYTKEHEKDWQKLDREFGPLRQFADKTQQRDDCVRTPLNPTCDYLEDRNTSGYREFPVEGYDYVHAYGSVDDSKTRYTGVGNLILEFHGKGEVETKRKGGKIHNSPERRRFVIYAYK